MPTRSFPAWIKVIVDRICQSEGISRQQLADRLKVHIHSVSTSAYRGEIGFELVERLCRLAKTRPEEITAIEIAWIEMKAQKPRDDALRRSVEMLRALMEHLVAVEEWLSARGLLDSYRRFRKRDPLVLRTLKRQKRAL